MRSLAPERRPLQAVLALGACAALASAMSCSSPAPEEAPSAPPPAAVGAAPAAMADTAVAEAAPISAAAVAAAAEAVDPTVAPAVVWLPPAVKVPGSDAASEAEMRPYTETIPGSDVTFEMVPIRGGVFTIGSPETEAGRNKDEGPRREVRVEPFWMGKCEVTWDEYALWGLGSDKHRREVRGIEAAGNDKLADAITQPTPPYSDMSFGMGKGRRPAICMTQLAAKMYCKWLCAKTGRYYRLPTEAEWEFACRAGSTGAHYGPLAEVAWTAADGVTSPQPVGGKMPNLNGTFDMLGNVWEWCWDLLDPARYGDYRVFRGGGFADDAWSARASTRRGGAPRMTHDDVGFRLARGGFDGAAAAQGWSAKVDAERAAIDGPLPDGWTPRR